MTFESIIQGLFISFDPLLTLIGEHPKSDYDYHALLKLPRWNDPFKIMAKIPAVSNVWTDFRTSSFCWPLWWFYSGSVGFSRNFVGDMLLPNCGSTQVWTSMKFWSRTPSGVCWTRRIRGNLKDFHSIVIKLSSIWIPGWPMLINLGVCQNLWCHIWVDEHP